MMVKRERFASHALALLAGLGVAVLALPVAAILLGVSWPALIAAVSTGQLGSALWLSALTTLVATALCLILGVPLAWRMAGMSGPRVRLLRAVVLLPLVLPPVAGGVALLLLFGRNGPVGGFLDDLGISLTFSSAGVVLAQTFVALPFMVLAAEAAFRGVNESQFDVARSLGASGWRQFWSIGLPIAAPGIAAGALLSWARAFGEFGATVTFAGSLPGVTETLPLSLYRALEDDQDAAVAVAVVMLAMSVVVVVVLGSRWLPLGLAGGAGSRARPGPPGLSSVVSDGRAGDVPAVSTGLTKPILTSGTSDPSGEDGDGVVRLVATMTIPRPDFDVDVDLVASAGRVLVLRGPNGAGKSTVLAGLMGIVRFETGSVRVGRDVWQEGHDRVPPQDRSVGWVPQDVQLFWHMSALDNVSFGLRCRGASKAEARAQARQILTENGLAGVVGRRADRLSGGQARRVAILRAVAPHPRVLLLDEPTSGLDSGAAARLVDWMRYWLRHSKQIVVLVTHDQRLESSLGSDFVDLDRGRQFDQAGQVRQGLFPGVGRTGPGERPAGWEDGRDGG